MFGFGIIKFPEKFKESQRYGQRMAYFKYNGIQVVTKKARYSTIHSCSYQNLYLDRGFLQNHIFCTKLDIQ